MCSLCAELNKEDGLPCITVANSSGGKSFKGHCHTCRASRTKHRCHTVEERRQILKLFAAQDRLSDSGEGQAADARSHRKSVGSRASLGSSSGQHESSAVNGDSEEDELSESDSAEDEDLPEEKGRRHLLPKKPPVRTIGQDHARQSVGGAEQSAPASSSSSSSSSVSSACTATPVNTAVAPAGVSRPQQGAGGSTAETQQAQKLVDTIKSLDALIADMSVSITEAAQKQAAFSINSDPDDPERRLKESRMSDELHCLKISKKSLELARETNVKALRDLKAAAAEAEATR